MAWYDSESGQRQAPPPDWWAPPRPPPRQQQQQAPPPGSLPGFDWTPSSLPAYSLDTDPLVMQAKSWETAGMGDLDAQLKKIREQSIIQFGDPELAGAAGFNLDPSAAEFARQNTASGISTVARLRKAHEDRRRALINRLAARGILRSGATGYQEGQESLMTAQQTADARAQILSYLQQAAQQDLDRRLALRQAYQTALQGAWQTHVNDPRYQGSGGGGFDAYSGWTQGSGTGPGGSFDPQAWIDLWNRSQGR